jgi:PAS domain-containing protein
MRMATGISLIYLASALMSFVAFAVMWRRRGALGARPLALMMLAAGWWALTEAAELQVASMSGKRLIGQLQYFGVVSTAPFFFHAAMALAGRGRQLSRGLLVAVWAIPLLSLVMAWTNPWHRLLWANVIPPRGDSPFATYEYGWWFWVLTAQHYLLMVAATVVLLGAIRRVGAAFRTTMVFLLLAAILPWIGNAAYNAKLGPWPGLNWLTLSLSVSGCLLIWTVLRGGLFDLLPQARQVLLEMMDDGIVVLNRDGEIIYGNRAARETLRLDSPNIASALGVISMKHAPVDWRGESLVETAGIGRWLDISVGPVFDRWGALAGRIVVARDVTAHKNLEDERERLIDELQEALRKVTSLEGMLPICAHCRNVRDDRGYWSRIEVYIGSRTPLEFTHAICPDCMGRFYPDATRGEVGRGESR